MTDAQEPATLVPLPPPKRQRRFFRVLRVARKAFCIASGIVAALVLLAAAYCVYTNWRGEVRMHAALKALEDHGIDAQMQAACFRDPPDADERNDGGARYYRAAFELLPAPWSEQENLPYAGVADTPGICEPLAPDTVAAIAAYLERKRDFFQAFAKAREHPEPLFYLRTYGMGWSLFDPVVRLRDIATIEALASLLAQSDGDADAACEACEATLDASYALAREQPTIIQLSRIVVHGRACEQIEHALSRVSPSPARLQALREKFLTNGERLSPKRLRAADLAAYGGTLRFLDYWWAEQDLSLQEHLASEPEFIAMESDVPGKRAFVPAENVNEGERRSMRRKARRAADFSRLAVMVCPGSFKCAFSAYIEQALKEYEALDAPDHVLAERAVAAGAEGEGASSDPDWWRVVQRVLRGKAQCRVAATALAVELYRVKNARWPVRLSDVEGGDLPDPFTGKPLKFRRTKDGVLIYSVGENLIDEGGDAWQSAAQAPASVAESDNKQAPARLKGSPGTVIRTKGTRSRAGSRALRNDDHALQLFDPDKRNVKRPDGPLTR